MVETYQSELSKAEKRLKDSQEKLLEIHLNQIKTDYCKLSPVKKTALLEKLKKVNGETDELLFNPPIRKNSSFKGYKAKEVRMKKGLSLDVLAKKLNIEKINSFIVQVERYESGQVKPSNPPKGKISKIYIPWLKEEGYNPFEL